MTITIESAGRRHYVLGNTYPIRAELKSAGCKWDSDRKAWYSGSLDKVERFAARVAAGAVKAVASYRKLDDGTWAVLVPTGVTVQVGSTVTVETKSGATKTETIASVGEQTERGTLCRVAPRERKPRAPRLPKLVGQETDIVVEFEGSKSHREPPRAIGDARWVKRGGQRVACILVGYSPAQYLRSEDAEDMGHYGVESGYYGCEYYRTATRAEFEALQAATPREDGVCAEVAS